MFSPSISLVRLQELKLWQGNYEGLIQKSKTNSHPADYEHLGVSLLNASNASDLSSEGGKKNSNDWDKEKITQCKPFEELLEEKLAEYKPMEGDNKPKKPFLKKGQGLARFRMGPKPLIGTRNINLASNKGRQKKIGTPRSRPKSPPLARKGILKKTNPLYHQYVDLSPLTMPDFVKPRGTWRSVFESFEQECLSENDKNDEQGEVENYEEFRLSLEVGASVPKNATEIYGDTKVEDQHSMKSSSKKTLHSRNNDANVENEQESYGEGDQQSNVEEEQQYEEEEGQHERQDLSKDNLETFNQKMLEKINEYAQIYFQPGKMFVSNNIPETVSEIATPKFKKAAGDMTLDEQKTERELKIFEELEKKVENSSFCSTNTSVANLLASTPQKVSDANSKNNIFNARGNLPITEDIEFTNDSHENVRLKLQEVAQKTDVLQQFLMNLRKIDKGVQQEDFTLDSELTRKSEKSTSTNTSFSEEHTRWSTRSPSLADNYTELDTTCQSDTWKKIDAGVNTSFEDFGLDQVKKWAPCKECEELREKVTDIKMKLSEIRSENSNLKMDLRSLERKYETVKRDIKKNKEDYQEKLENLQEELNQERKKLAREKTYFETYVKESQNRATKKEREEITQLKRELADVKELLKLKEMKSGATQARLRTQIKQQERELSELKITVEKLQKENAKLIASQKYMRHPQEVKMLHEINKNLSKLTEETFKKNMSKIGNSDDEENNTREPKKERKKTVSYDKEVYCKENDKCGKNVNNKEVQKSALASRDSSKMDTFALDLTESEAVAIEKQYENVFGNFTSPRNSKVSTNLDKTEKTLPDGSMEITYSNGNVKTISADGQVIVIKYFNGDTKETNLNEQIIRYHYASSDTWHMQYADGSEVVEYKDGQKCKKYPDGKTEVSYRDGSIRIINADGTEEHLYPDGRKSLKNLQGEQIILLQNGQREIHTKDYKRREYPDGTVRTLRKDGSVETVYANGRVRLKDAKGVLIMDTFPNSQSPDS